MNSFFYEMLREPQEALLKIRDAGLYEYGVYREPLYERLVHAGKIVEASADKEIAFGLNNNDFDRYLLKLFTDHAETVFYGMALFCAVTGASKFTVYLPEEETALLEEIKDKLDAYFKDTPEIKAETAAGIIPVRQYDLSCIFHL